MFMYSYCYVCSVLYIGYVNTPLNERRLTFIIVSDFAISLVISIL